MLPPAPVSPPPNVVVVGATIEKNFPGYGVHRGTVAEIDGQRLRAGRRRRRAHARETDQVEAVGVHGRSHAGDGAAPLSSATPTPARRPRRD